MNFEKLKQKDLDYILSKGIEENFLRFQIACLYKGYKYESVETPATYLDGIEVMGKEDEQKYISVFDNAKLSSVKFIPASGIATRMFDFASHFLEGNYYPADTLDHFFENFAKFPFAKMVMRRVLERVSGFDGLPQRKRQYEIMKEISNPKGLNFLNIPKALLPFYCCDTYTSSAMEEQIFESSLHVPFGGKLHCHFTIAKNFYTLFLDHLKKIKSRLDQRTKLDRQVTFSFQDRGTDAIALYDDFSIVRDANDKPFLRPSGHGALIKNLEKMEEDIIFIKSIDNTPQQSNLELSAQYKKVLAGKLICLRTQIFKYLTILEKGNVPNEQLLEMSVFLTTRLNTKLPKDFSLKDNFFKANYIFNKLNRPLRVCGMVKNDGQVGGAPFWSVNREDEPSLQIVELFQLDPKVYTKKKLLETLTHFNPVDMVCSIKSPKGEKYPLKDYINKNDYYITKKKYLDKEIRVFELPGLWNGSMYHWNSVFVEVPKETFSPVKTAFDLLKNSY